MIRKTSIGVGWVGRWVEQAVAAAVSLSEVLPVTVFSDSEDGISEVITPPLLPAQLTFFLAPRTVNTYALYSLYPAVSLCLFFPYTVGPNNGITSGGGRWCHPVANRTV